MTSRRLPALMLLLALVAGGFGLPIADAILYHSTPTATPVQHTDDLAVGAPATAVHVQSCVLWLSALTGSGVVAKSPVLAVAQVTPAVAAYSTPQFVVTQTDITLGQSRAPPIA